MARQLKVEIIGDASSLQKAFGKAEDATGSFGKTLGRAAKIAGAAAGAAALGGLFVTMKRGFAEMSEAQQVMAQTGAVLKSTGGAANVTARQVDKLAGSLSKMSGVDDEAIASGENLLLTFTNIRNEAGKNNDIFNQTTKATLDMAVAMGTDMRTAALQVGKALNDPAKGLTRLQRVGVTFTKSQQDMVKQLVASGDSMGAQRIILAELNKEFGGSAKAAGDTFPGQLNKLRNSFDEVAGKIVTGLLPYLQRFVDFINRNMPTIESVMGRVANGIVTAVQTVARVFDTAKSAVTGFLDLIRGTGAQSTLAASGIAAFAAAVGAAIIVVKAIEVATKAWAAAQAILNVVMTANPFVLLAVAIVALGAALVAAYLKSERFRQIVNNTFESIKATVLPIIDALRAAWARWGDDLIRIARQVFGPMVAFVKAQLEILRDAIELITALIRGDWDRAWAELKSIVGRTLNAIVALIRGMVGNVLAAASAIGAAVMNGILTGIGNIAGWLGAKLAEIPAALQTAAKAAGAAAVGIGQSIIAGVLNGLSGLWNAVKNKIEGTLKGVLGSLNPFSPVEHGGELHVGTPIVAGAVAGITKGTPLMLAALTAAVKRIASLAPAFYDAGRALGDGLATGLLDSRGKVVDAANELANAVAAALNVSTGMRLQAVGDIEARTNQIGQRIPKMAAGGVVTVPTLALIGEAGPEAVIPLAQMNTLGSGTTINLNFPNYVGTREELIREVRAGLAEVGRDNPTIFAGRA